MIQKWKLVVKNIVMFTIFKPTWRLPKPLLFPTLGPGTTVCRGRSDVGGDYLASAACISCWYLHKYQLEAALGQGNLGTDLDKRWISYIRHSIFCFSCAVRLAHGTPCPLSSVHPVSEYRLGSTSFTQEEEERTEILASIIGFIPHFLILWKFTSSG